MAIRVFKCSSCGHPMRLSGDECGACYNAKPGWQKPGSLFTIVAVPVVIVVGFFAFIMLAVPSG